MFLLIITRREKWKNGQKDQQNGRHGVENDREGDPECAGEMTSKEQQQWHGIERQRTDIDGRISGVLLLATAQTTADEDDE